MILSHRYAFLIAALLFTSHLETCLCETATIRGRVHYKDGRPAANAEVDLHFYGPTSGILPAPQRTNSLGEYVLTAPLWGKGIVTASKESEGFPNVALALYSGEAPKSARTVDISTSNPLTNVDLTFGDPDRTVLLEVRGGNPGEEISDGRIKIFPTSHPEMWDSLTLPHDGKFLIVLPKRDITVVLTAPGYKEWSRVLGASPPFMSNQPQSSPPTPISEPVYLEKIRDGP